MTQGVETRRTRTTSHRATILVTTRPYAPSYGNTMGYHGKETPHSDYTGIFCIEAVMRLTLFSCRWSISRNTSTHRALRVSGILSSPLNGIDNPSPFIWMQFLECVLLVVLGIPS